MKILFTQFTPPFTQVHSSLVGNKSAPEAKYLEYSDWYSNLRRLSAEKKSDTVKLVSLSETGEQFTISHDGYESLFFPVENSEEKSKEGRCGFYAPGLVDWVRRFDPNVIHMVGTGHRMADELLKEGFGPRSCLWERCGLEPHKFDWPEYDLCRFLVLPTATGIEVASKFLPREKLINFPLGANSTLFTPARGAEKRFDIMTVGGTPRKQLHVVREIVRRNNLSWLHVGSITKGWPFSKREDFLFFNSMKSKLGLARVKKAKSYNYTCGFFDNTLMPGLYNSARLLVHASLVEGAPRCVQEALASEVPVVVLKETVPYVEKEFGVACETHEEFESAVMGILGDEVQRVKMGRAGREWLVEKHSPKRLYEAVNAVNEKIAAEK
ncbi:MAG: glycosyltransferase [Proteobacteria bacterium]|nr:glycosyltransferase [Pseudomonadota bacterium]